MINKIKIENLTVFEKLEIDTHAPINVFIGENGTGKTQILKFIYMILSERQLPIDHERVDSISSFISYPSTFLGNDYEDLTHLLHDIDQKYAIFKLDQKEAVDEYTISYTGSSELTALVMSEGSFSKNSIYIPAKDMLTHAKGLPEISNRYKIDFDKTYIDIIEKSRMPELREIPKIAKKILPKLEEIMDGKVEINNDKFYIKKHGGRIISFDFEAEGIKKIGLLWQLLMSGTITKGTILLWDEPESNLNPKLTSVIANILLELSRNGVQVFLTTHSYFLAEYFDVLEKNEKEVIFHSLYRENDSWDSPVLCETSDMFSKLSHNAILDERVRLFDAELEKEFLS